MALAVHMTAPVGRTGAAPRPAVHTLAERSLEDDCVYRMYYTVTQVVVSVVG